jgi:hypothetical protein
MELMDRIIFKMPCAQPPSLSLPGHPLHDERTEPNSTQNLIFSPIPGISPLQSQSRITQ